MSDTKVFVRRAFARRHGSYAEHDHPQRCIAAHLADLLPAAATSPGGWIVDAGCGIGRDSALLAQRFGGERLLALDFALEALSCLSTPGIARVAADLESLPLSSGVCAGYWSNCAWQWTRPERSIGEAWRVLEDGAWLCVSMVLAGTFPELSWALAQVDATPVAATLPTEDDWARALEAANWHVRHWETRTFTFHYPDAPALLGSIRGVGANPVDPQRPGAWTPRRRRALLEALERLGTARGIPLSYRVAFCLATKTEKRR